MIAKSIVPGVYAIPIRIVNTFLIDAGELTLVDTGIPGGLNTVLLALEEMGKRPSELRHILVTHLHGDHTGSLAAIKKATGAKIHMHPLDAAAYIQGITMRPAQPSPGLISTFVGNLLMKNAKPMQVETASIDEELHDGQVLDFAGGLRVIHAPGHTAGHTVFLLPRHEGVLFVGDGASHMTRLGWSPIYEDFEEGRRSLQKLSALEFETACFAHGGAIRSGAAKQFKEKFAA